jgi:hypothetical protein
MSNAEPRRELLEHRRRTGRKVRHEVRSSLQVLAQDPDGLDGMVLPEFRHDLGRKASPPPKSPPRPGRRSGFKVWKTPFWKRRRRLWAERNTALRFVEGPD